jgi:hypothetical protein
MTFRILRLIGNSLPSVCRRRRLALLSLAAATALAGCSSAISTLQLEAPRTTALVVTALVNDPEIGARPISVRVSGGVVQLSGLVRSEAEVARAVALAGAVPGVTRVHASLRIGADRPLVEPRADKGPPDDRSPATEFAELEPTPSRFAIGVSFGRNQPGAAGFETAWSISPQVRLGARAGFGPAAAFDWHNASAAAEPGQPASRLRVRPIMAGLGYTVVVGRVAISPSLVGGYAFNRIIVPSTGNAGRLAVDADNSLVWRPGVSVWIDSGRRTAASLSVGRVFTRLNVTYLDAGVIEQRNIRGDATTVSVGLVYRLF